MASKPGASLVKARLVIMEPPADVGAKPGAKLATVAFQFNPRTLALRKSVEWRRQPSRRAGQASLPEFVGSGPRTLGVEVFLDATATHDNSVETGVEKLMVACVPTKKSIGSNKPASPWVRFEWGTAKSVSFDGVLSSLSVDYSLFDVDGRPLRATCSLSIEEAGVDTPGQNPTSGSHEARRTHRVVAGDSLPQLAWREYGDPGAWRAIAEANGIDDPLALVPGGELLLPGIDDAGPETRRNPMTTSYRREADR